MPDIEIQDFQPLKFPSPVAVHKALEQARAHKQLGLSPALEDGRRYWRVIWRPFLDEPIYYHDKLGRLRVKCKADNVQTLKFPILGEEEAAVFRMAAAAAREKYRERTGFVLPKVDWELLAKATGQVLKHSYVQKGRDEAVLDQAEVLFSKGWTDRMVADHFGVDRTTAYRWRKKLGINKRA